jgi:DNA-binding transcriptional regulator LsrR (DeoR family)
MTDYQLAQVAVLHHIQGLSQQDIAVKLGFSKMTVSRMLQRARDQGVVETRVKLPFETDDTWSARLRKEFGIQSSLVVKPNNSDARALSDLLGSVCAFSVNTSLTDSATIGVGIGRTMGAMVEAVMPMHTQDVHVVQLMGGHTDVSAENPLNIVQELCQKLSAKGSYIAVPAYLETVEARKVFFDNTSIGRDIRQLWGKCSRAVFGVGAVAESTIMAMYDYLAEYREDLMRRGAVGDILGHFFTIDGEFLDTPLNDRLVSIPVETLLSVPDRCAIAGGSHRTKALVGALRTGAVTHLVTDLATAKAIVEVATQ